MRLSLRQARWASSIDPRPADAAALANAGSGSAGLMASDPAERVDVCIVAV